MYYDTVNEVHGAFIYGVRGHAQFQIHSISNNVIA